MNAPSSLHKLHDSIFPGKPRLLRASIVLILATLPLFGTRAHASIDTHAAFELTRDGTPGFDGSDGPGLDSGDNNGIVRTHDTFDYQVGLSANDDGDTNVRIVATLPRSADGKAIASWNPPAAPCDTALSSISADGQTLNCVVDRIPGSATISAILTAKVLGTTANGTVIEAPSISISSDKVSGGITTTTPRSLRVSAAPFYDVVIAMSPNGDPKAYSYADLSGPAGENGFYHRPTVGLRALNPNGHGIKGVEQLDPDQPITIDLDVSGYPASVRLGNYDHVAGSGNPLRGTEGFRNGCGSNVLGRASGALGGAINIYRTILDAGPLQNSASKPALASYGGMPHPGTSTVANGGTCTPVSSDRNTIRIRLDGVDTSLDHYPTITNRAAGPLNIAAEGGWVAQKALALWTNLADYSPGIMTDHTMRLASISATSISGQALTGENTSNNSVTHQMKSDNDGDAWKYFQPDATLAPPYASTRDPAFPNHQIVNYLAHKQTVQAAMSYTNKGTTTQTDVRLCEIIDRTAFDIGQHFSVSWLSTGVKGTIQYGARAAGQSRYFQTTDSTHRAYDNYNYGTSEYATVSCDDSSIRWFNTPQEAENAGGLVFVRGLVPTLKGSERSILYVTGLILRETWASTITVLSPQREVRQAGDPIPEGTILRNRSEIKTPSFPQLKTDFLSDHLEVVEARTTSRVVKTVTNPPNTATTPVAAGSELTYRLQAQYLTDFPPRTSTVTVTDILPASLYYIDGSSTVNGKELEPEIQRDTPSNGMTTLVWTFPNVEPVVNRVGVTPAPMAEIQFRARLGRRLADGQVVRNNAAISGGKYDEDADCEYSDTTQNFGTCQKSAFADVRLQTPPAFFIEKTSSRAVIEPGDTFDFTMSAVSMGQAIDAVNMPDMIDILPFVGDGVANSALRFSARKPASRFSTGAYQLQKVTPPTIDPGAKIYYTNRAPTQIHSDPQDDSNRIPGGSTRWCLASELGTSGCPASVAQTTAVRISPSITSLPASTAYEWHMQLVSDAVIAHNGNLFANRASARPADPASSLQYVESQSDLRVEINAPTGSIAGRVFSDANQDNQSDPEDVGLEGQCITLRGTNRKGHTILVSMRTDSQGNYAFNPQTIDRVYPSADCTGTALSHFNGLLEGSYTLSKAPIATALYSEGATHAGTAGGSVSTDPTQTDSLRISDIQIRDAAQATGYNFTAIPAPPRLTLISTIVNDHGGTRTPADIALTATGSGTAAGTTLTGASGATAITQATVATGSYALSQTALPGYTHGSWECAVNGQPAVSGDTLSLTYGDDAVCTIRYDDEPARLTLTHVLDIQHGRRAQPTDIVLHADTPDGSTVIQGRSGEAIISNADINAGTYVLRADALANFTPSAWACTTTRADGSEAAVPVSNSQFSIANGEVVRCTIINSDLPMRNEFSLAKSVSTERVQPGDSFSYTLALVSAGEEARAPNIPEIIDILPFAGDGTGDDAMQRGQRTPASSFATGALILDTVTPPAADTAASVYYTHRAPTEIHNDPRDPSNDLDSGSTRWCLASQFGTSGCPEAISHATAVRIVPGLAELPASSRYEVTMGMRTDAMTAISGDRFANRAGAGPRSSASTLPYMQSPASLAVDVQAAVNRLAGRVFVDANQNNLIDGSDRGLAGQCVSVRGATASGHEVVFSMRTDDEGRYDFAPGAASSVYPNAECTGTPLARFGGLLEGEYQLARTNPSELPHQSRGAVHLGRVGAADRPADDDPAVGTVDGQRITGIRLGQAQAGVDYNFTDNIALPRLTLITEIINDHGGSKTLADVTLTATGADDTQISGISADAAVTSVALPVGDYALTHTSLPGYTASRWQCVVNGQAPVEASSLKLDYSDVAVCTVRLDDQPARLTLIGTVSNHDGGSARAEDFALHAVSTSRLDGTTGSSAVTGVTVPAGRYTLSADALSGYAMGPWECFVGTTAETDEQLARGSMQMPDNAQLDLDNGQAAVCRINQADSSSLKVSVSIVDARTGATTTSNVTVDVAEAGSGSVSQSTTGNANRVMPLAPGRYQLSIPALPAGYEAQGKWVCRAGDRELALESGNILNLGSLMNVSCNIVLKDVPALIDVSKTLASEPAVSGAANEFELRYAIVVSHRGGDAGVYDLVDAPAFDSDVQILAMSARRNGETIDIRAANDDRWVLATHQALAVGGTDSYELTARIRVPYGSSTSNDRCVAGTTGQGLYNRAVLNSNGTELTASACTDTPTPTANARLSLEKTSSTRSVEVGDTLTYRLRIRNTGEGPALSPEIVDTLPRGFSYVPGSVRAHNGASVSVESTRSRTVRFKLDRIDVATSAQPELVITYRVRVGVGSQEGDGINRAHIKCLAPTGSGQENCSNESRWKVTVTPGVFTDEACVAGQIFVDCNGNSVKDAEELGIPGVRLYLQNGTWLVSDEHGKYSHCGLRPRTHVIKVDSRTLPRRSRLVTSSAQNVGDAHSLFIDAKKGMLSRADFIEGSCSATVIEQVKARQAQASVALQTEADQPALHFDSKQGSRARPLHEGTDGANQPMSRTRH